MDEGLLAELLRRADLDQAARNADDLEAMRLADAENLPWLKAVVAERGWPGRSMVGSEGAQAAWLLAQHADSDPAFQRQCLDLVAAAVGDGEAERRHQAYLTDRVLLAEGKPQEFGTQAIGRDGHWVPHNLREPGCVDERRAAMSMGPLAEHLAHIEASCGPATPSVTSCPGCRGRIEFWPPESGKATSVTCSGCGRTLTFWARSGR